MCVWLERERERGFPDAVRDGVCPGLKRAHTKHSLATHPVTPIVWVLMLCCLVELLLLLHDVCEQQEATLRMV